MGEVRMSGDFTRPYKLVPLRTALSWSGFPGQGRSDEMRWSIHKWTIFTFADVLLTWAGLKKVRISAIRGNCGRFTRMTFDQIQSHFIQYKKSE